MEPVSISNQIKRVQLQAPVNVEALAASLGVRINYAYLDDDIAGELVRVGQNRYQINVNAENPPTRQRFTIAHELGHYIFHRGLIGDGVDDDRAYRSTSAGRYHNTNIGPREESEANRFAAELLMPSHLIHEHTPSGVNEQDIPHLARLFGVSQQSMKIRLGL